MNIKTHSYTSLYSTHIKNSIHKKVILRSMTLPKCQCTAEQRVRLVGVINCAKFYRNRRLRGLHSVRGQLWILDCDVAVNTAWS